MSSQTTREAVKKHGKTALVGLNAVAIIFLYTNFVPRHEFDKLQHDKERLEEKTLALKETVAILQNIHSKGFE